MKNKLFDSKKSSITRTEEKNCWKIEYTFKLPNGDEIRMKIYIKSEDKAT
jgi:hypothetical protein